MPRPEKAPRPERLPTVTVKLMDRTGFRLVRQTEIVQPDEIPEAFTYQGRIFVRMGCAHWTFKEARALAL